MDPRPHNQADPDRDIEKKDGPMVGLQRTTIEKVRLESKETQVFGV